MDRKMDGIDRALIALDASGSFRVYLADTSAMAEKARQLHNASPLASAALGRVLTGAGIMGIMLKNREDKLTVQFKGDGPAREILATAYGDGRVKGYISNPDVELPLKGNGKLDVGGALGIGTLTVIKDMGLKDPYMGRIDLVSGEIAEDLTAYFFLSEQQSTSVALGVMVDVDCSVLISLGMVIQMLPEAELGAIDALESMLGNLPSLTAIGLKVKDAFPTQGDAPLDTTVGKEEYLSLLLNEIFREIPESYKPKPLEYRELGWNCDCSRERLADVLLSLGKKDLGDILQEDGEAELTCQFCGKTYRFDGEELESILKRCTY